MNCEEFEIQLDAFSQRTLDEPTRNSMLEHQYACADCTRSLKQHRHYKSVLNNSENPVLKADTRAHLITTLNSLEKSDRNKSKRSYSSFAGGFIAASLLAVSLLLGNQWLDQKSDDRLLSLLDEDANLSQEITLVINVHSDMPEAELQLALPAEMSILGQEHLATVSLPVNLKKGRNKVVIPVQLEPFAMYANDVIVDATLIYKNSKKDFALSLDQHLDQHLEQDTPHIEGDELIQNSLTVEPYTNA